MKKYWTLSIPVFLIIIIFLIFYARAQSQSYQDQTEKKCLFNKKTARLLGEIYVLSNPMNDPNQLLSYIHAHWEYFLEDGIIVQSSRALGYWLLAHDKSYLDRDVISGLKERLMDCGISPARANELISQIRNNNISFNDIGKELIWLSNILPSLTRGDLRGYLVSGTELRKSLKTVLPIYQVLQPTDPEIAELILKDKNKYYQAMADQISLLALISEL